MPDPPQDYSHLPWEEQPLLSRDYDTQTAAHDYAYDSDSQTLTSQTLTSRTLASRSQGPPPNNTRNNERTPRRRSMYNDYESYLSDVSSTAVTSGSEDDEEEDGSAFENWIDRRESTPVLGGLDRVDNQVESRGVDGREQERDIREERNVREERERDYREAERINNRSVFDLGYPRYVTVMEDGLMSSVPNPNVHMPAPAPPRRSIQKNDLDKLTNATDEEAQLIYNTIMKDPNCYKNRILEEEILGRKPTVDDFKGERCGELLRRWNLVLFKKKQELNAWRKKVAIWAAVVVLISCVLVLVYWFCGGGKESWNATETGGRELRRL